MTDLIKIFRNSNEKLLSNLLGYDLTNIVISYNLEDNRPIAMFDLDHTLIKPKSGKVLPQSLDDWILMKNVSEKLKNISKEYQIVIISNQTTVQDGFLIKINNILDKIGLDTVKVFIAVGSDSKYRKPSPRIWYDFFQNDLLGVFFVGDALGRHKDISDSDYKFAVNLHINCYEPEVFFKESFNDIKSLPQYTKDLIHPLKLKEFAMPILINDQYQEVILLVGSPASGKTTFSEDLVINYPNYKIISKDKKTDSQYESLLNKKFSIIVDNTNPTMESRSKYIKIANKLNIPIRCIFFDFSKELIFHLNSYRTLTTDKHISQIVIYKFLKNLEKPTMNEGFSEIIIRENIEDGYYPSTMKGFLVFKFLPMPRGL